MKYKLRNIFPKNPETAIQAILQARGVTDIDNFLHPTAECELNPYNLENIEAAATKLLEHVRKGSKILLVVDCDQDGISSSAILWLYIKHIFPQADLSFIMHEHKQHGLNDTINWIELQSFNLVVVPDAGSYDVEEHQRLNDLGIDCIVIDHHEQLLDDEGKPVISTAPNTIVVNNQLSPNYSNKTLCGAGLAYKFCEVLDDLLDIKQACHYIDLAALGEIADVMDRTDTETNYIIVEGLKHISNNGLRTLIEAQSYSLKDKSIYPYEGLTAIDIAFYIAPLINALMRVGSMTEKEVMFYCFIEPERPVQSTKRGAKVGDIETAAEQTARVGKNAKSRQDKIREKALELIDFKIQKNQLQDNNVLIIEVDEKDNIPQEMSGLIAMGIVSKYNKPCLIVRRSSAGILQGSARGNSNFSALPELKDFLEKSGYFEYVAGHMNAFGAGIKANQLSNFIDYANKVLPPNAFENCYMVDYILDATEDNYNLLYAISKHPEYFGNHIDEIKIVVKNIGLKSTLVMGTNKDSIKINYNGVDYVKFKDLSFIEEVNTNSDQVLNVYGRCNLNYFNGRYSVQVFIDDYEFVYNDHKYDF